MLSQSELNPNPKATTVKHGVSFLRQKLAKLLPPMWYSDDLDTHHVVHDRMWVLRESRFLFFTRNGPVEITLKPTTVLASAIICMVGVSVIFLSTIFASYSAIEVMRDETIQTAEASITAVDNHLQRNTDTLPSGASDDNMFTWQDDITPRNNSSDLHGMIAGKTAKAPKPLPSRFNTQPQINAPSLAELSGYTAPRRLPNLSEIINADNEQDTHQANEPPENSRATDDKDTKEVNIAKADATGANLQSDAPIMDLALATTQAQQATESNLSIGQMPDQGLDQMAGGMITDAPPLTLPESNSAEYASTLSENEDSFAGTAAGFAIAMLPRLFSDPDPLPKSEQDKTLPLADNGNDTAAGALDDGFAITAHSGRTGPMLPSISDAARAQKCCYRSMVKSIISARALASLVSRLIICRAMTQRTPTPKTLISKNC